MTTGSNQSKAAKKFLLRAAAVGAGAALLGCSSSPEAGSRIVDASPHGESDAARDAPAIGVAPQDAGTVQDAGTAVGVAPQDAGIDAADAGADAPSDAQADG